MHRLLQLIEEVVAQELEEVNAVGAGGVSATGGGPLGQNMSPAHKKMWSGNKPLKNRKVQEANLADKMGLKKATNQVRRDVVGGSPVYMDRHDGDTETTKKVMAKVAKNLNRKPYSKKPPMMGLQEGVEWLIEVHRLLAEAKIDVAIEQEKDPEIKTWLQMFKEKNLEPKFIPWLIRVGRQEQHNWHGMGPAQDTVDVLARLLQKFNTLAKSNRLQQKDINQYSWESLYQAVTAAENTPSATQQKKAAKNDTTVFYQDNEYLILEPKSMAASCHYGYGTKWCISATQSQNYFDSYQRQGARFVFIINKKTGQKDAIALTDGGIEIYDAQDNRQNELYITDSYPKHIVDKLNQIFNEIDGSDPFQGYDFGAIVQDPSLMLYNDKLRDRFWQEPMWAQIKVLESMFAQAAAGTLDTGTYFEGVTNKIIHNALRDSPGAYAAKISEMLKTVRGVYLPQRMTQLELKSYEVARANGFAAHEVFPVLLFPEQVKNLAQWAELDPQTDTIGTFAQVLFYTLQQRFPYMDEDRFLKKVKDFWQFAASPEGVANQNVRQHIEKLIQYGNSVNWRFV